MDIHHPYESTEESSALDNRQADSARGRLSDDKDPVSWPEDILWPSNNYSNLRASAKSSMPFDAAASNMRAWTSPSSSTVSLHCYYPPRLAQFPSEEVFEQNWARVLQSHQRDTVSELTEDMSTPGFNFRPYNSTGPDELPAESLMKVPEDGFSEYIAQSHGNDQNQFFNSELNEPVRVTYVIPHTDQITSHNMRMETHQNSMSPQEFGPFEEHTLQSVIKPISSRVSRTLDSTSPILPSPPRRSLRSNSANMTQLLCEVSSGRSMEPLSTPYYPTSPRSPICAVTSTYSHQIEPGSRGVDDYRQGQNSAESPPRGSHGTVGSFNSPGISSNHLQRAASTGGLRFSAGQSFRGHDQQYWGPPRPSGTRWSHTEPPSPAEDKTTTMSHDRNRRSSLKTCELEEAGLDFPGCYVLVPTTEGPMASSETAIVERPEPGFISTKKNFRRPMVESERQAIKLNRKYGVCLRCKMFKERCRGGFPCERCRSLRFWKNICVTAQFSDKSIFTRGLYKSRVSFMLENVREWFPADYRHQEVVEIGNGYSHKLSITLQKFDPIDASLLEHILWRELRKTDFPRIPSSPYGIIAIEDLSSQLEVYFDSHINDLVLEVQRNVGTASHSHIYAQTLFAANKYTIDNPEKGLLVRKALRIWAAQIVFFKGVWRICGSNTASFPSINDRKSTIFGVTPLPRLANQQLDGKVESWIADLERDVLSELQHRIFRRLPTDWFGTYLAVFVTLSTLERDTWGLQTWAFDAESLLQSVNNLGLVRPDEVRRAWTWPLQETPNVLIERNLHLAETLTAHFRSVTKGWIPFTLDWHSDPIIALSGGEDVAVDYMRTVGLWIKDAEPTLRARASAEYSKEVFDSLSLMYCSRLMVSDREDS